MSYCLLDGLGYPAGFRVRHRLLTLGDVKFLTSLNQSNATEVIYEVLRHCCEFTGITIDDLYRADRDFLVFWIRSCSFIKNGGYTFDIPSCYNCGHRVTQTVRLQDLGLDFAKRFSGEVMIADRKISLRLPKINDPWYRHENSDIETIFNYTDLVSQFGSELAAQNFVYNLTADDYVLLMNEAASMKCGIQEDVSAVCPTCGAKIPLKLRLEDVDMFGKFDIRSIAEMQLTISKFANWQFSDDTPYVHIEVTQSAAEEMAKQEQQALNANGGLNLSK